MNLVAKALIKRGEECLICNFESLRSSFLKNQTKTYTLSSKELLQFSSTPGNKITLLRRCKTLNESISNNYAKLL